MQSHRHIFSLHFQLVHKHVCFNIFLACSSWILNLESRAHSPSSVISVCSASFKKIQVKQAQLAVQGICLDILST